MSVLVTGGAGFIGSHVARHLVGAGHDVVVLDDLSGGYEANVPAGATFVAGSVVDPELVEDLFQTHGFTAVFHLAAYAAEGLSHFIRRFNYTNNVLGSVNLLNAAVRAETVERFVFTSSIAVYGAAQTPMTEEVTPEPEDPYGIGKYAVELDLRAAQRMFGLDYTIFRPHNVYGEQQNVADPYRNVIGIFINQLLSDRPMTIFGDGLQTRAFTHIDDVAPVIARSIEVPGAANEVFNVGADTPHTVLDLAHAVARAFDVSDPEIEFLPAREEVVHAFSDHAKLHRVFGREETVPLEEGLRRMSDWAREIGVREPVRFESVEVLRNLPPSWAAGLTQTA
ncbi:MAG TPA: NAD-dependent epimerase/dehydratase family protein [Gaiellaceae bacterium]|jgi:UDP-glucose 4-epimerase|nr:NAD-dependent epimerase/dehydratase family protein [Gaiellaceae bacterium]